MQNLWEFTFFSFVLKKSVAPVDEELPPPPPELRNDTHTKAHIISADDDVDTLPPPVSLR